MTLDADILAILRRHPEGLKQPVIAAALGVEVREVQAAIQALRVGPDGQGGIAIESGPYGVRLASSAADAHKAALALRERALTQLETAGALERAARRMDEAEAAAHDGTLGLV